MSNAKLHIIPTWSTACETTIIPPLCEAGKHLYD